MGTSSRIAYEEDGVIYSIYVHFDGYIQGGTGEWLLFNVTNLELIKTFLSKGDRRSVYGEELYEVEPETDEMPAALLTRSFRQGCDFVYLFWKGEWKVCKRYVEDGQYLFKNLQDELSKEKLTQIPDEE